MSNNIILMNKENSLLAGEEKVGLDLRKGAVGAGNTKQCVDAYSIKRIYFLTSALRFSEFQGNALTKVTLAIKQL